MFLTFKDKSLAKWAWLALKSVPYQLMLGLPEALMFKSTPSPKPKSQAFSIKIKKIVFKNFKGFSDLYLNKAIK
ncbi:hypothetical protein HpCHC45_10810 [Helicobacter pylori]